MLFELLMAGLAIEGLIIVYMYGPPIVWEPLHRYMILYS